MSGIATAMVVGTAASGYMSSRAQKDAAGDAAGVQSEANRAALAEQKRQFDTVMQTLQPYVQSGQYGMYGLPEGGLSERQMYGTENKFAQEVLDLDDASLNREYVRVKNEGGDADYEAALYARMTGEDPTWAGSEYSDELMDPGGLFGFAQAGEDALPIMQEFAQAGSDALGGQRALAGLDGAEAQAAAIEGLRGTPEYDMLVGQAEEALLQNASATGGVRGGNTSSALMETRPAILTDLINRKYSQYGGLASAGGTMASALVSGGQNAFGNIFSAGQASAAGQANAAQNFGASAANIMQNTGTAQANSLLAGGAATANQWGNVGDTANTIGTLKLAGVI